MDPSKPIKQCRTCPWRVGADPYKIPYGYSVDKHCSLRDTIAEDATLRSGPLKAMACHYSKPGREFLCAGWLENQLGVGNNINVRLALINGQLPSPVVDGPQHETFEATLPPPRQPRQRR